MVICDANYKILKFGGSSLKSYKEIKNVADIIIQSKKRNENPIIICSACGDSTNKLLNLKSKIDYENFKKYHYEIIKNLEIMDINNTKLKYKNLMENLYKKKFMNNEIRDNKYKDHIISFGEKLSTLIVSNYLNKLGIKSNHYNSYDLGFITNNNYGNAKLLNSSEEKIKNNILNLNKNCIPVITGFIGKSKNDDITTLGRGGSDLTATIIGKCINAKEVQVWKDVDGIYTCDPKLIKESKLIDKINYFDALEMAKNGAKILHPIALEPCIEKKIPVIVKNSYNIKSNGTLINNDKKWIRSLTYKTDIALIKINSKENIFKILNDKNIDIDVINMSEKELCISINEKDLYKLNNINEKIKIKTNLTSLTIINSDIKNISNIISKSLKILEKNKIDVYLMSKISLKKNITLILESKYLFIALSLIHKLLID
jgi:aspartate kinase